MRKSRANTGVLLLFILCGIVIGGFLGEFLGEFIPLLKFGYSFGVSPHTYNLRVIELTLGFAININIFTVLGIIIGIMLYKRM